EFHGTLIDTGVVRIADREPEDPRDVPPAVAAILEFERGYRRDLPLSPPAPVRAAIAWSALAFHRACRFLVNRGADERTVRAGLARPPELPRDAATAYSV